MQWLLTITWNSDLPWTSNKGEGDRERSQSVVLDFHPDWTQKMCSLIIETYWGTLSQNGEHRSQIGVQRASSTIGQVWWAPSQLRNIRRFPKFESFASKTPLPDWCRKFLPLTYQAAALEERHSSSGRGWKGIYPPFRKQCASEKIIDDYFPRDCPKSSQSIARNSSWGIIVRAMAQFSCYCLFSYCFCSMLSGIDLRNGHSVITAKYLWNICSGWIARSSRNHCMK